MAVPKRPAKPTPTGKSVPKKDSNTLSSEDLVKRFKSKNNIIKRSGKKEAPSGFSTPEEIIKKFDLKVGKGVTVKARLNNVKMKLVNDSVVMSFNFSVIEGANKGTPLQNDIWIDETDDESFEKSMDSIIFLLQKLGYETEELDISLLAQLAEELTQVKPCCIVYLNCFKHKSGKNKGKLNYGLRVNSPYDPESEDDGATDEEDAEEDSEDEEGDDPEDGDSSEDQGEEDSTDDDESDSEDDSEEESEEGEFDADDPSTWIGYVCKYKPKGSKVAKDFAVVS